MASSARVKAPSFRYEMDLVKLVERFHNEDKARAYLIALRWPHGVRCPRCWDKSIAALGVDRKFDCNSCRYQFTVTSGTVMHDTHPPLWKWFLATYLMCESKKGISALQMKRSLGVAYRTAWYLCHRIRKAMSEANEPLLVGTVEVDETLVGGKVKGMGRGYRGNKTIVVGVVQRGGKVRLQVVTGTDRETLHKFIREHIAPDAEAIYTDEWAAYEGIGDADTRHETVNHSLEEWSRGDVHTNSAENVWSLLKRSIVGAYHQISAKHLDAYLNELEWRFNNRDNVFLFRDTLRQLVTAEALPYRELVQDVAAVQ